MAKLVRRVVSRIVVALILLAILVAGAFAYLNRQVISDHFAAQGFEPSTEIATLVDRLPFTDAGRRIFLASEPTLEASQRFNEQCADVDHDEDSHVIGCFTAGRIHLFNIQDERLSGVVEATAAHELLHATFYRLEQVEKEHLSQKLRSLYDELAAEMPEVEARMAVYTHLPDMSFANELHSVFGTEVAVLPEWLEAHYAQWFSDRTLVVQMFEDYHAVFTELRVQVDELQAQLDALRVDVEGRSAAYEVAARQLQADVADFRARNEAYEFSGDEARFYAEQSVLMERSDALETEYFSITDAIAQYEELREELNRLGATSKELNELLNSDLAPPVEP